MLTGEDLRKVSRRDLCYCVNADLAAQMGYEIPLTTVEEYTKKEDWSLALNM